MIRGARSTKIETEKRVFIIQGWIINSVPDYLILKNIQQQFKDKNGIPVGKRQAKNLLDKAYVTWQREEASTIEQKRIMRIAELKQDIRNMKDEYKGTPRGMAVVNSIKKEISKLEALYPARMVKVQGDKENPIILEEGFGPEKQKRLDELVAKALSAKQL